MQSYLLSALTFIPVLGMVVILLIPRDKSYIIKVIAAVTTGIQLWLAVQLFLIFDRTTSAMQFVEHYSWIPAFNIEYYMGVDGLSAPMIMLTALLSFICIFASWNIEKAVKGYFALFLLLDAGMIGVFVSIDFFLFFIFWEVMLLPMYFLIGVWGGPRREYAAIKFFLYTLLGSVLILLAMLALYFYDGQHTFNMLKLMQTTYDYNFQIWVFLALFIGFAIKVPIFPFHTWLPDAHVEAPTAVSVILAGVLLKMGIYGLLRINYPILSDATLWFAVPLAVLGLINIVYGALCALAQTDLKKLVAYSSISHMGFCLIGMAALTTAGMNGAVLQMFNHGTITAMLFLLVGVIYDRTHIRDIDGFGGLAVRMPIYAGIVALAFFAGLGLPGFSGFISEALTLIGGFGAEHNTTTFRWITGLALTGIVLNAAYFLWAYQKIFLGKLNEKWAGLSEINGRELFTLVPLAIIVIILGFYPMPILGMMSETMNGIIEMVKSGATMAAQ
ncbi:MAG: NADH-quinone oxidoreductase subunit M [Candidatus Marinimicrobia bacterium]|nr:NADH-quinone oxidoreductase subunit M [Candidatus Neomarinimicrobiota bacterium]